jgi:hypothetical protein
MGKTLQRPSAAKEAAKAKETALNLNGLLDEGLGHLDKLVKKRSNGGGKKPLKLKLRK